MIGSPYSFVNELDDENIFTSKAVIKKIRIDEKNFRRVYVTGLIVFGASSFFVKNAIAKEVVPNPDQLKPKPIYQG